MAARFEELDWRPTPMGEISLRRRRDPVSGADVHEVKLGDDFLMSSLWTVAEVAVARLALAALTSRAEPAEHDVPLLDVAVGGLGLGYTARAVLEDSRVRSLVVVERLEAVVDWHRRGLVPLGPQLTGDQRCRLVAGDFFAMAADRGFDPDAPGRRFDAVVVDIDHSPRHLLDPAHGGFYDLAGTRRLARHLRPGGVFALWSNDPPDEAFGARLAQVFTQVRAEIVSFHNPLQGRAATNTVYLARAG